MSARGFTLVELLVGATVATGIIAAAYLALDAGYRSKSAVDSGSEALQQGRTAIALLAEDLRAACALTPSMPFVGMNRDLDAHAADNLDFATHRWTPRRPGESDFAEVSYFVEKDLERGSYALWRRRDPTPDLDPLDGGRTDEIAADILGFDLEYLAGAGWYDEWGEAEDRTGRTAADTGAAAGGAPSAGGAASGGLPDAVRITLEIAAEEPLLLQAVVRLRLAERGRRTSGAVDRGGGAGESGTAPPAGGGQ